MRARPTASIVAVTGDLDATALAPLLSAPAAALADGLLVAFPTETVYGLGADACSAEAVAAVFRAKGRPADNPLIVHLPGASWIPRVGHPTPLALALAERFWPGPLTLVLQAHPDLPAELTGGGATVAVRVPDSRVARTLIELAGVPVAAPSANRSGRPSPTTAAHVAADLGGVLAWIVDGGACRVGIESTVVDARGESPVILREGAVTGEQLGAARTGSDARSPGTRHPHYQPVAVVRIAPPGQGPRLAAGELQSGRRVGLVAPPSGEVDPAVEVLATPADADALGRTLYASLRAADDRHLEVVVVEAVGDAGVGRAVMDRLRRAAAPRAQG